MSTNSQPKFEIGKLFSDAKIQFIVCTVYSLYQMVDKMDVLHVARRKSLIVFILYFQRITVVKPILHFLNNFLLVGVNPRTIRKIEVQVQVTVCSYAR